MKILEYFLRPRSFDALGIERAEELGVENGITPFPFELQVRFESTHYTYRNNLQYVK